MPASTAAPKGQQKKYKSLVIWFWILLWSPIALLLFLVAGAAYGFFGTMPSVEELQNPETNQATVIYAADMKVLGKYYSENRVNAHYKELNQFLVDALIATEDARYRDHSGIDARGLGRVMVKTVLGGDQSSGGGSTVTQQLAKMLFPRQKNRNKLAVAFQKLKEWVIAVKLERQYTKEDIITLYFNKFDFNYNAVGIKSASQIYFNKTPDSLRLEEAAMLVGMAKNPSLFNPIRRPDTTLLRRNVVMSQMVKYGYLKQAVYDSLKKLPLNVKFHPEGHNEGLAAYFREHLRKKFLDDWIEKNPKANGEKYDLYRDGLKIYTTIDSRMQQYAEEAVTEHMKELQDMFFKDCKQKRNAPFAWNVTQDEIKRALIRSMHESDRYIKMREDKASDAEINKSFHTPVKMTVFSWHGEKDTTMTPWDSLRYYKYFLQTGFMSMEPQTGYIKAWVGGINHKYFKYDHVEPGHRRQVGSTFKPFVYALAIQEGMSPCDRLPNVRTCITTPEGKEWCPNNSDNKHDGELFTLKKALANSVNFITAYLMKQYGPKAVVSLARKLGIEAPIDEVPAICLGTPDISVFEMVGANSAFVNKGTYIEPIFVTRIEDKDGKVLQEFFPKSEEALSEENAYVMIRLMEGVCQFGTGVRLRGPKFGLTQHIAGKTGTTQNNSDGWFIGLTPELVSGCWTGGDDRSIHFNSIEQGQGASMALPIWGKYMKKVYADKSLKISQEDFPVPQKKISIELDCKKYENKMDQSDADQDLFN